jgi:hypothetical protein
MMREMLLHIDSNEYDKDLYAHDYNIKKCVDNIST